MTCASHAVAKLPAHKYFFRTPKQQLLRINGLLDTGNTGPGSAAISAALATQLGVRICPSQLQVTTAAEDSPLEVVGTVANMDMATSATNLLQLKDVVVYKNLSHPLNLGLNFFRQLQAKLDYEESQPQIMIRGESHPLLANIAPAEGGGTEPAKERARDQLRSQKLPGKGQSCVLRRNRGATPPSGQESTLSILKSGLPDPQLITYPQLRRRHQLGPLLK